MCSLSCIQPQFCSPMTHFVSVLNGVRSLSAVEHDHAARIQRRGRAASNVSSVSSAVDVIANSTLLSECVNNIIHQLGLRSVPPTILLDSLNPFLCTSPKSPQQLQFRRLSTDSFISSGTFFENKYGFPEKLLSRGAAATPLSLSVDQHAKSSAVKSFLLRQQQVRGFQTKPSSQWTGFGGRRDENLKSLKQSVFDKLAGGKSSEKMRAMMTDPDVSPAVQEKLKVAFAEGYMANDKKPETSSASMTWLRRAGRIIYYAVIVWLVVQILQTYTAFGGNMKINVLKGDRFEINPEEINVTFDDVKGVGEAKQELTDIVEYLRDAEKFRALGAKLPKGVLLVGPPGIGKSLLARAIAGEAGVPFFHASGSEFDEVFVGTGAKRVRQLFDAAKMRTPCIVFIDEIDTVGAKRTSSQIHPYANQTINQLLSEMDGFQQNEGIIVLGATNRRDNLDKALLRPGRFDVEVRVFRPDLKGRQDILDHYLNRVKVSSDVDTERIARGTTGCTGADLENMVNQAALKAAMDGDDAVTMVHLDFARDKVLMGPAKKTKIPSEEDNLITAYHEAGHTLVSMYTKDAEPVDKVTIIPRGPALGFTSVIPEKEMFHQTKAQLLARMDLSMGGRIAEEIIFGPDRVTTGAQGDFMSATSIATYMVKQWGMSEKVGVRVFHEEDVDAGLSFVKLNEIAPATTEVIDNEIKRLLQESYDRAKVLVKAHQSELKLLAQALMKYETLNAEDVKAVIEGKPLPSSGTHSPHVNPRPAMLPKTTIKTTLPV